MKQVVFFTGVVLGLVSSVLARGGTAFAEVKRFRSPDAHQGVAVGESLVYAIGSRSLTAHDKRTGAVMLTWNAGEAGVEGIIHLDSGVVKDGELYCGHSNFPLLPMTGSVEIFDAATLRWKRRHVFDAPPGSCTWVDWHDGAWWVCFAHYNGFGGYPDKDNSWTTLVRYDSQWREVKRWRFPGSVLERFGKFSCSGGSWGPEGMLYCTGHDLAEVYVFQVPEEGETLSLKSTLPLSCLGQGIAWDRNAVGDAILYAIRRRTHEVTVNHSR